MAKNPVVHFEMPYEDKERVMAFYHKAFGWDAKPTGPEMGEYIVMQTAETTADGMVKEPGRINGGMFKKLPDESANVTSLVVAVEDIHAAMQRVTDAGGELVGVGPEKALEPVDIPGVGLYIGFRDSEGNRGSILQPGAGAPA